MVAGEIGSGDRFEALKKRLADKEAKSPGGLAASIGRKKYGKEKSQRLAAIGKQREKYGEKA